eukprot:GGOE01006976.1.p1 GENE.GGOE01006976.1~~GGOE01006976.1.p1  ORF type:complete len:906 (-),score=211.58 GGOE01006976.1:1492-4173(-)
MREFQPKEDESNGALHFRHHFTYTFSKGQQIRPQEDCLPAAIRSKEPPSLPPQPKKRGLKNLRKGHISAKGIQCNAATQQIHQMQQVGHLLFISSDFQPPSNEVVTLHSSASALHQVSATDVTTQRLINQWLMRGHTQADLIAVIEQVSISEMNCVNICTVCSRLAKLFYRSSGGLGKVNQILNQVVVRVEQLVSELYGRQVSVIAHAFAKLQVNHSKLMGTLAERALFAPVLRTFVAQDVANMSWAFASLGVIDLRLMGALAERAMEASVLNELKAREVANIAWAFATLNIKEPTLMNALANRCASPDVINTLNAQDIANLSWAYASLGMVSMKLIDTLSEVMLTSDVVSTFNSQAVSNTAWSFGTLHILNIPIMQVLAQRAMEPEVLSTLSPHGLANLIWAYAVLDVWNEEFMHILASRALEPEVLNALSAQKIARISWSFARLEVSHPVLMEALALRATRPNILQMLTSRHVTDLAWAYATLNVCNVELMDALVERALSPDVLPHFWAVDVASMVSAYAKLGVLSVRLMEAMAEQALRPELLTEFNAPSIANMLSAYAVLDVRHPQLPDALVSCAIALMSTFDLANLSIVVSAAEKLGLFTDTLMEHVVSRVLHADILQGKCSFQTIGKLAASMARLGVYQQAVMDVLVGKALSPDVLSTATSQGVADLIWACATMRVENPDLLEAMQLQLQLQEAPPPPEDVARIAWCLAVLGVDQPAFFSLLATLMLTWRNVPEMSATAIAEMAWAFAVANVQHSELMAMLVQQTARAVNSFTCVDVCNLASAIAKFKSDNGPVMSLLARQLLTPRVLQTLQVPQAVGIMWAFAALGMIHKELITVLSTYLSAPSVLGTISRPQAITLLWSFSHLHLSNTDFVALLSRHLQQLEAANP